MGREGFIDGTALQAAIHAHRDRTALHGPKPIHRIVSSLHVDADEFQILAQAIADQRDPADRGIYAAGFLDGFVIGVRAARCASQNKGGK